MKKHNHKELCEIGAKFLKRSESGNGHGCHFAVIEPACYGENPDVFGIRHGTEGTYEFNGVTYPTGYDVGTVVLEAKTSRSDFLADRKKPHRMQPETGIGKWRYFICPTDVIKPTELPEKWGLIYVNSRGHCNIVAGAMSVPKEKHVSEWRGKDQKPLYHRNGIKVAESFIAHAFNERNTQNEFNLLTMALARLGNAEDLLYMQRSFSRKETELQTLQHEHGGLKREYRALMRKFERYGESVSLIRTNLMSRQGYSPYCGNDDCIVGMPRTLFKDDQFHCMCGWVSALDAPFIAEYKQKWNLEKTGEPQ